LTPELLQVFQAPPSDSIRRSGARKELDPGRRRAPPKTSGYDYGQCFTLTESNGKATTQ
jgi:hypothetical protein